jgi:hypothetical protein
MACPDPFEALSIATQYLGNELYRYPYTDTFFFNYITRGTFPKNKGVNMTTFTVGNSEPTDNDGGWTDVTLADNVVATMCNQSYEDVAVGFDSTTYAPRRVSLAGPIVCRETLSFAHNPAQFFSQGYLPNLAHYAKRKLDLEFRYQAMKLGTKVPVTYGLPEFTGSTQPTTVPSSQLTQDVLDVIAARLNRNGASSAGQMEIELGPDGPVYPLVIGQEMSMRIAQNVSSFQTLLEYADMGKGENAITLKRMGASKRIKNFRHYVTLAPPRANFVNGIITEVDTWEMVAATEGTKAQFTTAYNNAQYEAAIVVHPEQFIAEWLQPDNAGLAFDPVSWMGDWKFVTGAKNITADYTCLDPLKDYGRHFAKLLYAPRPIFPSFGVTLWFRRCVGDTLLAACTST